MLRQTLLGFAGAGLLLLPSCAEQGDSEETFDVAVEEAAGEDGVGEIAPSDDASETLLSGDAIITFDNQNGRVDADAPIILDAAASTYNVDDGFRIVLAQREQADANVRPSSTVFAEQAAVVRGELIARGVPPQDIQADQASGVVIVRQASVLHPGVGTGSLQPAIVANPLASISVWLTSTQTLTARALGELFDECVRQSGNLTADCAAAVSVQSGGFAVVPEDARAEFALLLRECETDDDDAACREAATLEREFRALRRGELDPEPKVMAEGQRTRFSAAIRQTQLATEVAEAGAPLNPLPDAAEDGSQPSVNDRPTIIPFSRRMCFQLTSDAADFLIQAVGDECQDISQGSMRRFQPEWDVTPLRAGRLELFLATSVVINGVEREFRHREYPLMIDVTPKPTVWEHTRAWLGEATATVTEATGLAQALGALFLAISGWVIWRLFKRRSGDQ